MLSATGPMSKRARSIIAVVCLAAATGMWFVSLRVPNEAIRWYATPGTVLFIIGFVFLRNALRFRHTEFAMNWYDITEEYHKRTFEHDGRLSSLQADWQRELAALWRLEADVNNGA